MWAASLLATYGRLGMTPGGKVNGPGEAFIAEARRQLFGSVGIGLLGQPGHGPNTLTLL